jgi:hypothetical protein
MFVAALALVVAIPGTGAVAGHQEAAACAAEHPPKFVEMLALFAGTAASLQSISSSVHRFAGYTGIGYRYSHPLTLRILGPSSSVLTHWDQLHAVDTIPPYAVIVAGIQIRQDLR